MQSDNPIVVALAGSAGSGKTTVANALAPVGQIVTDQSPIQWTHLYFALPLYKIATARQKIKGDNAYSRQCYEIHETLTDVFRGGIEYDQLVDLTYEIMALDIDPEGTKPRSFLQHVGTELCRSLDPNVWIKWMARKINQEYIIHQQNQDRHEEYNPDYIPKRLGVVISDCRFENECKFIHDLPVGILIRFDVSPEVAAQRISNRDGVIFSSTQSNHASEKGLEQVPINYFDTVINTDYLTIPQQVQATVNFISKASSMYSALHSLENF